MTSPSVIRGSEQWNRWFTDHSPLLMSEDLEGKSRMLGGGIRLLLAPIGAGGMGKVYRARDSKL
jgi:hypothetical protein